MRLIDAEELLEHLEACLQNGRSLSNLYDLSEIVRYVKSMPTVAASPWHRVEEPPKENGRYFVSWEGAVTTDEYKNGVWLYASMFTLRVTHWMPIPEPPNEVTNE